MIVTPAHIASLFPGDASNPFSEWSRVEHGVKRLMMLDERFDDLASAYIAERLGQKRADVLGPPDTSHNPVVSFCRAVSTPGCYGSAPSLSGGGIDALADVIQRSGLWSKKQQVQFYAAGMGACGLYLDWPDSLGYLRVEPVPSCYLWALPHPDDPQRPMIMRRLSWVDGRYLWHEWDLSDPDLPTYRVVEAKGGGDLGDEDLTPGGALVGDDYPWRAVDGSPLLPWVIHRHRDDGSMWSWQYGRGAFRGALQVVLLTTIAHSAAQFASSNAVIVAGMKPLAQHTRIGPDGQITMEYQLEPGAVIYHEVEEGHQPYVHEIGPGQDLDVLAGYVQGVSAQTMVSMGITPPDATRRGANPQSGEAIHLSNEMKRYEQERVIPLCLLADRQALRIAAGLAHRYGGAPAIDADEVGLLYRPIPESPNEQRAARERDEWDIDHGLASRVDLYLDRHPGVTREAAIAELRRIAAEERAINAAAPEPDPNPMQEPP